MGFIPPVSPYVELFILVLGGLDLLGIVITIIALLTKSFQSKSTFLWHRKFWVVVAFLQVGALLLFFKMGQDLILTPVGISMPLIILFFIILPASCQYNLKQQNDIGIFETIVFLTSVLLIFYSIFFKFPFWKNNDQSTYVHIPTAVEPKLRAEPEKVGETDKAILEGIAPDPLSAKNK